MDDTCAIVFPVQADRQFEQAPGAFQIAAWGAAQGFEEHLNRQRGHGGRRPVAEIIEQVAEIGR